MESRNTLTRMLEAESVALIGASERPGSVGATMLSELTAGTFSGRIYPVNPNYEQLNGIACYRSLKDVPEAVDLVVLGVSNAALEAQLRLGAECNAGSAVIFSSCYEAPSPMLPPLTERLASIARLAGMAVCGGNCMGFVNLDSSVRACAYELPSGLKPGRISLITHSGSAFSAFLKSDRGLRVNLAVSSGQELVTTAADYLRFALDLESTLAVGLMLEQIRDPAAFATALLIAAERNVAVFVLKVGSDPRASELVTAHSGALAGDDGTYEAFLDAHAAHRVFTLDELADALVLCSSPRRAGSGGLAVVGDSGGERALIVDLARDIRFAEPSPRTTARLAEALGPELQAVNPVDAWSTGRNAATVFAECIRALFDERDTAAVAFAADLTLGPDSMYVKVAKEVFAYSEKPFVVMANLASGVNRSAANSLTAAGIPVLEGTATGLAALRHLFDHRDFRSRPPLNLPRDERPDRASQWRQRLVEQRAFDEVEALSLLADYGIRVARSARAIDEQTAIEAAESIGWPVALKTAQLGIHHKSEVSGVVLSLSCPADLQAAYKDLAQRLGPVVTVEAMVAAGIELALGMINDAAFGPVIMVAAGGSLVEVLRDRKFALPPLDVWRAGRLVDGLSIRRVLEGVRGAPAADVDAVIEAVTRLSELVVDLGDLIEALDVNPLVAGPTGCIAADALILPRRREPTA
jgi:acyl-CoA synthetase (NDP forming)